ncbi:MAG: glycosyltransferase family 4 protein [Candidatus Micrarchaeota archaeon]
MAKKGHEVTVVTTSTRGAPSSETLDKIQIIRFWSFRLPIFSSVRLIPFLPIRLALMNADIYHSHGYGSTQPFFTAIASLLSRRPFVFTVHGYPKLKGLAAAFKWFYTNIPARIFLRVASKIITVADATIPDIEREAAKDKITTIPNGVDFEKFKQPNRLSSIDSSTITYIGRFDSYKGIDTLIRAFATVKKKKPEAELVLIGRDEGISGSLRSLASELGVEIEFREASPSDMPAVYGNMSIVVLPSKYEGLSLVLLEAIASERPMLSTPVGAAPRVFREVYGKEAQKFLFEVDNHYELAGKIINVLDNRKEFEKTCTLARIELSKRYSWSSAAIETLKVYEEVLSKKKKK